MGMAPAPTADMPSHDPPPASDAAVGAPQEFGSGRSLRGDVALGTYAGFTPYLGVGAGIAGSLHDGSIRIDGGLRRDRPPDGQARGLGRPEPHRSRVRLGRHGGRVLRGDAPHAARHGYRDLDLGRTAMSLFPSATVTHSQSTQQVRFGVRCIID